jgi:hypothetical protein
MTAAEVHDTLDWKRPHQELLRLSKSKGEYDAEEARWLLLAFRARAHEQLGFATFFEYLERTLGYPPRLARERLRVAEALDELPRVQIWLSIGRLHWSAVRELTRVATPDTECEWIDALEGRSSREIEQLIAGRVPGDRPSDPPRPDRVTKRLSFDVSPETHAIFREAVGRLRQASETPLSDEDALQEMARRVLGGPGDDGEASYQIALTLCSSCGDATQRGRGESVPVDDAVVEQAMCDARTFEGVPRAVASEDVEELTHVGRGAPDSDAVEHKPAREPVASRSSQIIPPATRRRVMARDDGRCVVPGCRCATYVDLHHLRYRSDGGDHDDDNLVVLCGAHHRAVHRGKLWIDGRPSTGLEFAHADGTRYGTPVDPANLDALAEVTAALRALGFTASEATAAARAAVTHVGRGAPWDELMRVALALSRETG